MIRLHLRGRPGSQLDRTLSRERGTNEGMPSEAERGDGRRADHLWKNVTAAESMVEVTRLISSKKRIAGS